MSFQDTHWGGESYPSAEYTDYLHCLLPSQTGGWVDGIGLAPEGLSPSCTCLTEYSLVHGTWGTIKGKCQQPQVFFRITTHVSIRVWGPPTIKRPHVKSGLGKSIEYLRSDLNKKHARKLGGGVFHSNKARLYCIRYHARKLGGGVFHSNKARLYCIRYHVLM